MLINSIAHTDYIRTDAKVMTAFFLSTIIP